MDEVDARRMGDVRELRRRDLGRRHRQHPWRLHHGFLHLYRRARHAAEPKRGEPDQRERTEYPQRATERRANAPVIGFDELIWFRVRLDGVAHRKRRL